MLDPTVRLGPLYRRAGLENLLMHDQSRSLAYLQIDTGIPVEVIQRTLGHESITTTVIYARMALETVRASVERAVDDIPLTKRGVSGIRLTSCST